jgi:ATP-dependent protease ClpP protease subunit
MNKISMKYEVPPQALARWNPSIQAKKTDEETINIYSTIGDYGDGMGMTPKLISGILRKAEGKDVVVNINSPGGDFFDGIAIHTLLSEYEGNVKVRIVGLAASAASVVALAGDEIEIAEAGFFMIHNAWTVAMGNKEVMKDVADMLSKFDESMVSLYSKATSIDEKEIKKMMSAETWLTGETSVELGFAKALIGKEEIEEHEEPKEARAMRRLDVALAKAGMPRSERRDLLKEITSTPRAAEAVTHDADSTFCKALRELHEAMT